MKLRRLVCVLLLLLLCCPVWAAEAIDTSMTCTLTVEFSVDGAASLTGMQFDLYRVADVHSDGSTSLCPAFSTLKTPIALTLDTAWGELAEESANLVRQEALTPERSTFLDAEGRASYSQLDSGIYLVLPRSFETANGTVYGKPAMAALPLPLEGGGWSYDVKVHPKGELTTETDYLEVVVIWEDRGFEDRRPDSVPVDLYCDGSVVDTKQVSTQMQWQYRWQPLPVYETLQRAPRVTLLRAEIRQLDASVTLEGEHSWYVVEREAEAYTKTYTTSGSHRFVIINTLEEPTPTEPSEPTLPTDPTTPTQPVTPPSPTEELPKTGLLWWPVPVLAVLGLALLLLGRIAGRKRGRYE